MRGKRLLFLLSACCLLMGNVLAQGYPVKPIRLIVGFAPGGGSDAMARLVAQKLTAGLGQSVVVDNRGGAGGIVAEELVAKATPDGYTLLVVSDGHMINAALYRKLPYDTIKDFAPVSIVSYGPPHYLLVNASVPAHTVKELIALAKAKPGQLNFGSGGIGSGTHLEGELLKSLAGINIVHVPYKGTGLALTELASGQLQMLFASPVASQPFIKAGKMRAIAVTSSHRVSMAPDLPTVAESGLPEFVVDGSAGLIAPARTPKEIINKLNAEIVKFVKTAEMREFLARLGAEPGGTTPQEYAAKILKEVAQWKKVVKDAGIPIQ